MVDTPVYFLRTFTSYLRWWFLTRDKSLLFNRLPASLLPKLVLDDSPPILIIPNVIVYSDAVLVPVRVPPNVGLLVLVALARSKSRKYQQNSAFIYLEVIFVPETTPTITWKCSRQTQNFTEVAMISNLRGSHFSMWFLSCGCFQSVFTGFQSFFTGFQGFPSFSECLWLLRWDDSSVAGHSILIFLFLHLLHLRDDNDENPSSIHYNHLIQHCSIPPSCIVNLDLIYSLLDTCSTIPTHS